MLLGVTRRVDGLKLLSGKRDVPSGGRSLGTIRPPAVTRIPGGLPCSLRSFSALPRLMEGVGEGLFCGAVGMSGCATGTRRLLPEDLLARFADADADGRRTCSAKACGLVSIVESSEGAEEHKTRMVCIGEVK